MAALDNTTPKIQAGRRMSLPKLFVKKKSMVELPGLHKIRHKSHCGPPPSISAEPTSAKRVEKKHSLMSFFGGIKTGSAVSPNTMQANGRHLSPELADIAKKELNETEVNVDKGLAAVKEHITTSKYILKCKNDEEFLLRFLRAKKYRIKHTIETLDKYLSYRTRYPTWFGSLDPQDEKLRTALSKKIILPLPDRDQYGRTVILVKTENLGTTQEDFVELFWAIAAVGELIIKEVENQVRGVTLVIDFSAIGWSHLTGFPMYELIDGLYALLTAAPLRYRAIYVVGAPKMLSPFIAIFKSLLSSKIKKRLIFYSEWSEFVAKSHIPPNIFPSDDYGLLNNATIFDKTMAKLDQNRAYLIEISEMRVDQKHADALKSNALVTATSAFSYMARIRNCLPRF